MWTARRRVLAFALLLLAFGMMRSPAATAAGTIFVTYSITGGDSTVGPITGGSFALLLPGAAPLPGPATLTSFSASGPDLSIQLVGELAGTVSGNIFTSLEQADFVGEALGFPGTGTAEAGALTIADPGAAVAVLSLSGFFFSTSQGPFTGSLTAIGEELSLANVWGGANWGDLVWGGLMQLPALHGVGLLALGGLMVGAGAWALRRRVLAGGVEGPADAGSP